MTVVPQNHQTKVATAPPRLKSEKLTEIAVNNGHDQAFMTRELDPQGAIVVHPVKKSVYVHERWHDLGSIDHEMYDAAERFRKDFERGHLEGRYATIDLFRSSGGGAGDVSDVVAEARGRIHAALFSLGARKSGKSLSQSCAWFVVGCGMTLEQWSLRMRTSGETMAEAKAAGVLYGALEKLAWHYGIINTRTIKERASKLAEQRASHNTLQKVLTLAELSALDPEMSLKKFTELLKQKFLAQVTKS